MKLVILDRDGVINHDSEAYIKSPAEWIPLPGSLDAIARLTQAGFQIAVATNQSGIARGLYDLATLGTIHSKMYELVQQAGGKIDAVFFCPHNDEHQCQCRKPKSGMVLDIIKRFKANPADVLMIGDKLGDLQAAHGAGCRGALVHTGYGSKTAREQAEMVQALDAMQFKDLAHAVNWLCALQPA